jgi:histidine ammonia-lyase
MGANSATKALRVADNVQKILAIELYNAAQALEFRRPLMTSPFLEDLVAQYRTKVEFVREDTLMYKGINETISFLDQSRFVI